jgi:segregation and condensation protein B
MTNNENDNDLELNEVVEAAEATDGAEVPATEGEEGAGVPFDEESLLELAQKEGLAEGGLEESAEAEASTSKESLNSLSEEQKANIMASMETLLFMNDKPVSLPKLRSVIAPEVQLSAFRVLMAKLREEYAQEHRGVEIAEVSLGFQLRTKPHMVGILRKLVKTQPLKLTPASMEVLAVSAYKQPVTKDELDSIRGVDSGYVLRNLMEKRLIRILGRSGVARQTYALRHHTRVLRTFLAERFEIVATLA